MQRSSDPRWIENALNPFLFEQASEKSEAGFRFSPDSPLIVCFSAIPRLQRNAVKDT